MTRMRNPFWGGVFGRACRTAVVRVRRPGGSLAPDQGRADRRALEKGIEGVFISRPLAAPFAGRYLCPPPETCCLLEADPLFIPFVFS